MAKDKEVLGLFPSLLQSIAASNMPFCLLGLGGKLPLTPATTFFKTSRMYERDPNRDQVGGRLNLSLPLIVHSPNLDQESIA